MLSFVLLEGGLLVGAAACLSVAESHAVGVAELACVDCGAACLFFGLCVFGAFGFGLAAHAAWFAGGVSVGVPGADAALFLGLLARVAGGEFI